MTHFTVELSGQDLGDFLDHDRTMMGRYASELSRRLHADGDTADVEITGALVDRFMADDLDRTEATEHVQAVMARMANELDSFL